jgi:hypothetical protein
MSELREAAQAVVAQWDTPNWKLVVHTGVLIDRLRAALAQPEAEAQPVAWRKPDGAICTDAYKASCWKDKGPVEPLYTHPPRDAWRPASDPPEDGRNVIVWYTPNDPAKGAPGGLFSGFFRDGEWWPYSGSETVTHWRDVPPPTTEGE